MIVVRAVVVASLVWALLCLPLRAEAQQPREEIDVTGPAGSDRTLLAQAPQEEPEKAPDRWEQVPPEWSKAARSFGDDALYLLTSPLRLTPGSALVVGGIVAGVAGISLADRSIRHDLASERRGSLRDAADNVSLLGNPFVLLGVNVGTIAVGEGIKEYNGNRRLLDAALVATESQLFAVTFTEAIAYGTGRSRPDHHDDPFRFKLGQDSFPSSHASQAFAVAAVLDDRFDQPVGAIAYALAGAVALSRLVQDQHWASDVAAGAALGWAIGHSLSARHRTPHRYLDFFPFADPKNKQYGLVLQARF